MKKHNPLETEFVLCDFENPSHTKALVSLINEYMQHPMGGSLAHNENQSEIMVNGLASHSSSFVLFVKYDGQIAGLATCFINFSTFRVAPYINVHDLIVSSKYRGLGLGRALMGEIISMARKRGYCKVNLEVREDNPVAMALYQNMGFNECDPPMRFWEVVI
jgi:ribosomal protein S18 acetylase RimI-like enzyme